LKNKEFRKIHKQSIPNIYKFFLIVLNIPSLCAFIERFLAYAVLCVTKEAEKSDELVCIRFLLKANYTIILEISEESLDAEAI
jgi:hypothetical protein